MHFINKDLVVCVCACTLHILGASTFSLVSGLEIGLGRVQLYVMFVN